MNEKHHSRPVSSEERGNQSGEGSRLTRLVLPASVALILISGIWCFRSPPFPLSILFLGFSEEQGETAAVFQLTNNTLVRVDYSGEITPFLVDNENLAPEAGTVISGSLKAHESRSFPLLGLRGTNTAHFRAVLSATVPRPAWQQRITRVLSKAGVQLPRGLSSSTLSLHSTNTLKLKTYGSGHDP